MKKRNRMLLMVVLVFAVVLNMATGVLATEQEHDHNWVLQGGGSRGHTFICDGCGQSKLEDHTVDSSEICTVCGVYYHTANAGSSNINSYCFHFAPLITFYYLTVAVNSKFTHKTMRHKEIVSLFNFFSVTRSGYFTLAVG